MHVAHDLCRHSCMWDGRVDHWRVGGWACTCGSPKKVAGSTVLSAALASRYCCVSRSAPARSCWIVRCGWTADSCGGGGLVDPAPGTADLTAASAGDAPPAPPDPHGSTWPAPSTRAPSRPSSSWISETAIRPVRHTPGDPAAATIACATIPLPSIVLPCSGVLTASVSRFCHKNDHFQ